MKRSHLCVLLAVLLCVPLLAGNYRVGGPQQSNQSDPLGRYAFVPIDGMGMPWKVSPDGYVFAYEMLWHPVRGVMEAGGGGEFQSFNNSNQAIIWRPGESSTGAYILKNMHTGDESVMTSGLSPPDGQITSGEIVSRTKVSDGVPITTLNDLGQAVGGVSEDWMYVVREQSTNGTFYFRNQGAGYESFFGRWNGATQILSLESAAGVPGGTTYTDVGYAQFTTDQRVALFARTQHMVEHSILWDLVSNTATVGPIDQVFLLNNHGLTVTQRGASPDIEVVGQGVAGYGSALAVTDGQPPPYNTPEYPMIVGGSGGMPRIWARIKDSGSNKVWEEIDPCSRDQRYSGTLTAANSNGLVAGWLSFSNQPPKAYLLVPAALVVDANRDGTIKFAGNLHDPILAGVPPDSTSEARPFRFWVNDDFDQDDNEGDSGTPDWQDGLIQCARDLEDFSRLKISVGALRDLFQQGKLKIGFEWKQTTGSPAVQIYPQVQSSGSDAYLKEEDAAEAQVEVGVPTGRWAFEAEGGGTLIGTGPAKVFASLPTSIAASGFENTGVINLLFEGCGEGKGLLCITIHNENGTKIGDGPGVWLDLLNIKKMYQRGKAAGEIASPYSFGNDQPPPPAVTYSPDSNGQTFSQPPDEAEQTIIFVHGWRMTYDGALNFAETMFKRLWHRGYKGRFASFSWPTFTSNGFDDWPEWIAIGDLSPAAIDAVLAKFNESEYRAWKSGAALKQFVEGLPYPDARNICAHSMGNIVVGSALKQGMPIQNYVLMQAAVPSGAFNTAQTNHPPFVTSATDSPSPDGASDLGYRGYLASVNGNLVNFHNFEDDAMEAWDENNIRFKPNAWITATQSYGYSSSPPPGQRCQLVGLLAARQVLDPHESMAFVALSLTLTAGRESTGGSLDANHDLNSNYNFGDEHSAQWTRQIQQLKPFYDELINKLEVGPANP